MSWLNLVFAKALFLIPIVRFPGFIWLIATAENCYSAIVPN